MVALYAVVSSRPSVLWFVVGWAEGWPQMVPVGRYVQGATVEGEWRALRVTAGQVWMPARNDEVIYGDRASARLAIVPEVDSDGE